MMRKYQVRFGGGPTEKGRLDRHLAGGLPYVPPASYSEWLDPETPVERLTALLRPYPADEMQVAEVGPAVSSPRNDGPECLEAA